MEKILVIGIAGGTGSGKTTLMKNLIARFGDVVTVLSHDNYYRRHDELTYEERSQLNYDEPAAMETELMVRHLDALRHWQEIDCPVYDFSVHNRSDETIRVVPRKVIIVEGIMTLYDKKLRDQMDLKIFVDAEPDERLLRVIVRDIAERGHPLEMLISKYRNVLKPMHDEFIEPTKQFADIIIPNGGDNERAISMMKLYI